jgi:hypothetical protein
VGQKSCSALNLRSTKHIHIKQRREPSASVKAVEHSSPCTCVHIHKAIADSLDLDIVVGSRTSCAPDWARGFRQPEVPALTHVLNLQAPFEEPFMHNIIFDREPQTPTTSEDEHVTPGASSSGAHGPVVTVEEVRANKRFKESVPEEMSSESVWNLLAPVVMPDCRGE